MSDTITDALPTSGRKRDYICDRMRDMAFALGPGCQLPTVIELCAQFNVAKVTLDGVLGQLEDQGIVERRHRRGLFVSANLGRKVIGVVFGGDIFSEHYSPFWSLLLKAVRDQTGGRSDLLTQAYMDISQGHDGLAGHSQLLADLESRRLHGLLLFTPASREEVSQLAGFGVPLVDPFEGEGRPEARHAKALRFARELAARGCRRVACLQYGADEVPLLADALREAGVAGAEVLDWTKQTWETRLAGITNHESFGRLLMARMIAEIAPSDMPDALANMEDDTMTRGAITAMLQAGLKPGQDMTVVSLVNKGSPVLDAYSRELVSIEIDPADIVREALAKLEQLMNAGTPC